MDQDWFEKNAPKATPAVPEQPAGVVQAAPPESTQVDDSAVKGFADQVVPAINPLTYLRALRHPIDTGVGIGEASLHEATSALGNAAQAVMGTGPNKHPVLEALRHTAGSVPLFGPPASHLVDVAESGKPREAMGGALGMLLTLALSKGLGSAVESAAPALARTTVGLGLRGRVPPNEIPAAAQTVLDEGIVGKGSAARHAAKATENTTVAALDQGRAPSVPARNVTEPAWDRFVGQGNKTRKPMKTATEDFVAANPHGLSVEEILRIVRGEERPDIPPNAVGQRLRDAAETNLDPATARMLSRERAVNVVNDAYGQHRPFGDFRAALNIESILHPQLIPAAALLTASHSPMITSAVGNAVNMGGKAAAMGAKAMPMGKGLSDAEALRKLVLQLQGAR